MSLLQIYQWVWQWKNFENRLTFGEVMGKSLVSCFFFETQCSSESDIVIRHMMTIRHTSTEYKCIPGIIAEPASRSNNTPGIIVTSYVCTTWQARCPEWRHCVVSPSVNKHTNKQTMYIYATAYIFFLFSWTAVALASLGRCCYFGPHVSIYYPVINVAKVRCK